MYQRLLEISNRITTLVVVKVRVRYGRSASAQEEEVRTEVSFEGFINKDYSDELGAKTGRDGSREGEWEILIDTLLKFADNV